MTDWVSVDELCADLVSVSDWYDVEASAIAEIEAHRHTRDAVTAAIKEAQR
jgi:hypothetical protein